MGAACELRSAPKQEQLSWGLSFSVLAQNPVVGKCENAAYLLTRFVLCTNEGNIPKKLASLSKKHIVDSEDAAHAGQTRQLTLYAVSTSALWGEADMICTCEYKCISAL